MTVIEAKSLAESSIHSTAKAAIDVTLVAHSDLPSFSHLKESGHELLSLERAQQQDIRELHIGFLNMMPDAALQATERQFIRLVGGCNRIAQFYVYPFSLPELQRSRATEDYIKRYYSSFEELRTQGLDALIITGANVVNPKLQEEAFWEPLLEVASWAQENVSSTLCSCLATHALLKHFHDIDRQPMDKKRWGVFEHRVCDTQHPLMRDVNTRFTVPHSRYNDISRDQLENAGLTVLSQDIDGGVHLAVCPDQIRVVYFQGHPEYDRTSLLKEYVRELRLFVDRKRATMPPLPDNYFPDEVATRIIGFGDDPASIIAFLSGEAERLVDNTWGDSAKAVISNWLGLVYQLTNQDRRKLFMPGVDPADPLRLKA